MANCDPDAQNHLTSASASLVFRSLVVMDLELWKETLIKQILRYSDNKCTCAGLQANIFTNIPLPLLISKLTFSFWCLYNADRLSDCDFKCLMYFLDLKCCKDSKVTGHHSLCASNPFKVLIPSKAAVRNHLKKQPRLTYKRLWI